MRQPEPGDRAGDARRALQDRVRAARRHVQQAERDQVEQHDGRHDEDAEGDARVLPDAEDVEPRDGPDDGQDDALVQRRPERQERGPVDHRAHGRDAGGQDVRHHDRRDGDEGGHRPEHEVGEGVDATAADVVQLQDLRDLDHARGEHAHEQRGPGDEEDRLQADEAVRLGGRVEDRGELVHQRDEPDREPGEVPLAALGKAEEPLALEEDGEEREQPDVQPEEGEERHASASTSKSCSSAATPSARVPSTARPRAFEAGSTQRRKPCRAASRRRASERPTARTSPVSPTSPHTTTSSASARPRAEEATAATTARSAAGSSTRSPPATFRNTSWSWSGSRMRFSSTASRSATRPGSRPMAVRRGMASPECDTRAWISTRSGRLPSSVASTAEPGAPTGRSARKAADGFGTSASPPSPISNTATSLVEPKRFLTARSTRSACAPSPSK